MQSLRRIAAYALVVLLTACGGGGGSASGGGVSVTPPQQTNISQQSTQRADVQSGLGGIQAYESFEGGGSLTTFVATRALSAAVKREGRAVLTSLRRDGASGCDDGVVTTEVPNSNDTVVTLTVSVYYDAACNDIESTLVWAASATSSTEISGPAMLTNYSTTGAVTETANATIAFYINGQDQLTGISILESSTAANGVSLGQAGVACNVASTTAFSCGVAAVANITASSLEDGANVSLSGSETGSQASVNMQVSAYQGAPNALSVAVATFPDWTISPSSDLLNTLAISGSGSATSVTLTLTDSANDATLSMTGSVGGTIAGTLTNNATGATVATFTVNAQGSGTVTYGNGSTASIVDYIVQG